ncbi:aldo-keto reductase family 1 member B1-like [Onthophagus taurus]|uniref:aldo-keto reductase family 1 member B1-like n=1 Tax=Onthophagus taurus TaxID=166361 RepID=UPI000C20F56E|nr:aldose reductase-like [Onthophagus taurus]
MKFIKLNSGHEMPVLGLGTYQGDQNERDVEDAVKVSIDLGYTLFDCAHVYNNEEQVGKAIEEKINEGKVKREDLFVVTKLWNTNHNPRHVEKAMMKSLSKLKLDYVDLYLIHWPTAFVYGDDPFPKDDNGNVIPDLGTTLEDTWKAMEDLVDKGFAKSIGISNFNSEQIEKIMRGCKIPPAVNQIECHPYLIQEKLRNFCKEKGVAIMAYSPLGSRHRPWAQPGDPDVLSDQKLSGIAEKYNKTPAQILLRFQIELGNITIPKSSNPKRLQQNIDIFNFELTKEDVDYIKTFDMGGWRICSLSNAKKHPEYPFHKEY